MAKLSYLPPAPTNLPAKRLVVADSDDSRSSFTFYDDIEIGRLRKKRHVPGVLMIDDPTVSSRHCVITQEPNGRCFIRDLSRNGTRVDGRRLSPNLKTELAPGQTLSIGQEVALVLDGDVLEDCLAELECDSPITDTVGLSQLTMVTVLVGDIRNYTSLVRHGEPTLVQESVSRVFDRLEQVVEGAGGTLKEFQGDAIFAFWEQGTNGCHAVAACRTAIELDTVARQIAEDTSVWDVPGHRLEMDFALCSGPVNISGYGNDGALGLSMIGEPVVLAFRIEKFADDSTGSIIVCPVTRQLADKEFTFKSLGPRQAKGFDEAYELYALVEPGPS